MPKRREPTVGVKSARGFKIQLTPERVFGISFKYEDTGSSVNGSAYDGTWIEVMLTGITKVVTRVF